MFMVLAKLKHRKRTLFLSEKNSIYRRHSYTGEHTASNFPRGGFQFSGFSNSVSLAAPKAAPPGPNHIMTGSLWSETPGHPETFCVLEYLTFMLQEAWDNGNIARNHSILSGQHRVEYKFLFPTLTCGECCFPHSKTLISVEDSDYLHSNRSTNRWYDGVFISSFAQLAAHYAHLTVSEQSSVLGDSYK
jgi:hypothetical protein